MCQLISWSHRALRLRIFRDICIKPLSVAVRKREKRIAAPASKSGFGIWINHTVNSAVTRVTHCEFPCKKSLSLHILKKHFHRLATDELAFRVDSHRASSNFVYLCKNFDLESMISCFFCLHFFSAIYSTMFTWSGFRQSSRRYLACKNTSIKLT